MNFSDARGKERLDGAIRVPISLFIHRMSRAESILIPMVSAIYYCYTSIIHHHVLNCLNLVIRGRRCWATRTWTMTIALLAALEITTHAFTVE